MIGPLITTAILSIKKFSVEGLEFQKLHEIFRETYHLNLCKFFTFTRIHTLRLQKCDFLYETGFLPGFKFSTSHFICVLTILLVSFWIDWLWTKEPRFRGPSKSRQMRWYTYKHIHIQKSQMRLASGTGNPGSSRTWPELVCCEAWWLRSDYKYNRIYLKVCQTVSLLMCFVFGDSRSIRLN